MATQRRDVLHSPRIAELKKRRRRNVINKILLILGAIGIICIFLAYISKIERLNITDISVTGNKIVDTEEIIVKVKENLEGKYIWLIPKTNFLVIPKNKIKEDLEAQFKRLKDIRVDYSNQRVLEITVSEREGKYMWCGEVLPETELRVEDSPCYFADEMGYVFDEAPYFRGDAYFRFYGQLTDSQFAPVIWNSLISFRESLIAMKVKPTSMYMKEDGDVEVYLSSSKMPPLAPKIIFKSTSDYQKLTENLEAAMGTEPLHSDFRVKYSSLSYIDLRFGNKVYFKFSPAAGGQ